mmetsp:Transcript_3471/g.8647  ORF Transcript_3471/g.8647 Transcript_3471/m.8647 type:complete len:474 (+) Transcript_3471:67-1488(+)
MSWYSAPDGQQVWVARDESVYILIQPTQELEVDNLTYLTSTSKKAVYQEHLINEELDNRGKVPRRQRERMSGRQRGFILRVDHEEAPTSRVVPWFKASANKLVALDVVSHMDAEEAANLKKKKKNDRTMLSLGVNECRVETTSRIHHFAHGPGFRVEVAEGSVVQKIHFFTCRRQLTTKAWHSHLLEALEACCVHVLLAKRAPADEKAKDGTTAVVAPDATLLRKTDKAQQEDDAWLKSVINGCITVYNDDDADRDGSDGDNETDQGQGKASEVVKSEEPKPKGMMAKKDVQGSGDAAWRAQGLEEAFKTKERRVQGLPAASNVEAAPAATPSASSREARRWVSGSNKDAANAPTYRKSAASAPSRQFAGNHAPSGAMWEQHEPWRQENGWDSTWWQGHAWNENSEWQSHPTQARQDDKKAGQSLPRTHQQPRTCSECRREIPHLCLWQDTTDGAWYCRKCWLEYYGTEPPPR